MNHGELPRPQVFVTGPEMARILGVGRSTLARLTKTGEVPSVVWLKRTRRYEPAEVIAAMKQRKSINQHDDQPSSGSVAEVQQSAPATAATVPGHGTADRSLRRGEHATDGRGVRTASTSSCGAQPIGEGHMQTTDRSMATVTLTPEQIPLLARELTYDLKIAVQESAEADGPMDRDQLTSMLDQLNETRTLLDALAWGAMNELVTIAMDKQRASKLRDYFYEDGGEKIATPQQFAGDNPAEVRRQGRRVVSLADAFEEALA